MLVAKGSVVSFPISWLAESPGATCPDCAAPAGRPVLYGMPTPDVLDALATGAIEVVLGGCCIAPTSPSHRCQSCGSEFGGFE